MMGNMTDDRVREAAAARIFAKRDAILREQRENKEQQGRLAARERELDRELAECRAAARFFDLENFDPPAEDAEIEQLRARLSQFMTRARLLETRGEIQEARIWRGRAAEYEERLRVLAAAVETVREASPAIAAASLTAPPSPPPSTGQSMTPKTPRVRDIVLDQLRAAADKGGKAAAIKRYIEATYTTQLHDKTVGMTLYRLSQEKAVHRKGQTWFFGPPLDLRPTPAPEDPGVSAPGPTREAA